jgi:ATP-dependent RNA helicase DDX27
MRKAEMELKKGQNMIEHEAEIFSRPARTWFQTNKEKQKAEGSFKNFRCPGDEFDISS